MDNIQEWQSKQHIASGKSNLPLVSQMPDDDLHNIEPFEMVAANSNLV
ncbi:hypothetical protein BH23BAC1_BH23BAC1_00010 [soil metagenome]